jgi:hypothetical protein
MRILDWRAQNLTGSMLKRWMMIGFALLLLGLFSVVSWDNHNQAIGGAGPYEILDIEPKTALQNRHRKAHLGECDYPSPPPKLSMHCSYPLKMSSKWLKRKNALPVK